MIEKDVMQILIENSIINCSIEELNADDDLVELGLDSFNFIQLIVLLEERYSIEFDAVELTIETVNTVSKIKQYILSHVDDLDTVAKSLNTINAV